MLFFACISLCSLIAVISAAPAPATGLETRQGCATAADPDCQPDHTDTQYHATFEDIANGTQLSDYQGLTYTGFQTVTEIDGLVPDECDYIGPQRGTNCHYAYAAKARAKKAANLPTIEAASPATLMKLTNFSFAIGPSSYFGRGGNLTVIGYFAKKNGHLVDSGVSATFFYAASQNVGEAGAGMGKATMPANFIFDAYRFNVSSIYASDEPELLLDEINAVTYTRERDWWRQRHIQTRDKDQTPATSGVSRA